MTDFQSGYQPEVYQRKLYTLLRQFESFDPDTFANFACLSSDLSDLETWWQTWGETETSSCSVTAIAQASDRLMFRSYAKKTAELDTTQAEQASIRHLISGQPRDVNTALPAIEIPQLILKEVDARKVFFWIWRFYPDLQAQQQPDTLLVPVDRFMPDCSLHSYASTVSALTGAMFPEGWQLAQTPEAAAPEPYLLLFSFSPVQEFIKASRKFLDFWAGSYLLHYLSAYLCWTIAKLYGADAIITPSLWGQEIIDTFLLKEYPEWKIFFQNIQQGTDPIDRFNNRSSTSLSTAGFPNTLTVLVPSKAEALELGKTLSNNLKAHWAEIAVHVREDIKTKVSSHISKNLETLWNELENEFDNPISPNPYRKELEQYKQPGCWEWNPLWEAQIGHTWEPYYIAVPLGHPDADKPLQIPIHSNSADIEIWINAQNNIAQPKVTLPSAAEKTVYQYLNVGTWWGSYQARLGQLLQAVKNTRNWQIPVAPGERSSLSGQYSAVHPRYNYQKFQNGRGMTTSSIRLFWRVMAVAYPGVFNGSEKLNAIELTKRMAWFHGGIAKELGIEIDTSNPYDSLIRFPNLSSIAAARFASAAPERVYQYWEALRKAIYKDARLTPKIYREFCAETRRPFHIQGVDSALKQAAQQKTSLEYGNGYNGVMFSSKWLADDLNLKNDELAALRELVADVHQKQDFGDGSPADWWVLVLGDGDGMGNYVSGTKLKPYEEYVIEDLLDFGDRLSSEPLEHLLKHTKKRMGPATHVGLNRALLDFSNRLVPYLTEQRFCGRVIYSGGDDVMVALPLADLPGFLRSLRAAWSGEKDPDNQFHHKGGYWYPPDPPPEGIPKRPLFTMGKEATMSLGIVIAHKSVPLPTVLESLWTAEKDRAKKMLGSRDGIQKKDIFPVKDGLCFRVIYSSGNTLEALMKGHLLESWYQLVQSSVPSDDPPNAQSVDLSPVFHRLAEELPRHARVTEHHCLCSLVAKVILSNRDEQLSSVTQEALKKWLDEWEAWAWAVQEPKRQELIQAGKSPQEAEKAAEQTFGTRPEDLGNLLRFSAFWVSRRQQELSWVRKTGGTP